jgi:hypothetical protein
MEIVLLNTPPGYGQQIWVDNIKYMLDNNNREYDKIHVVDEVIYGGVYDKLLLFDRFREGQYLYFDLDIVINGPITHLYTTEFTVLLAWWRDAFHTPLNSSIMSWYGNHSYIHNKFAEDPDYYMIKYNKGIDEFLYKEIKHKTYEKVCDSYAWGGGKLPITLYNHAKDKLWEHECTLSGPETNMAQNTKTTLIQKYQT